MTFCRIMTVKAADDLSKTQKSKMFDKLRDRMEKEAYRIVEETLNTFTKEDGVFITQVDLFGWAKCLDEDGKHQNAYEVYAWVVLSIAK
ncbi:hypothetical protein F2Q68_00034992 [Brassica cretica]|uniref:Uncharacterized protein n=2 Tax=Brassica cretica TaxID=69181 RepID=A0A8S9H040_BRACR|nr:hypothetical protein F2Q68_00034992 [Brassica cretica]KAF3593431.1 hypothetical protein DY000_02023138 [Brassica cretica]